jgi:hypothetical protein
MLFALKITNECVSIMHPNKHRAVGLQKAKEQMEYVCTGFRRAHSYKVDASDEMPHRLQELHRQLQILNPLKPELIYS